MPTVLIEAIAVGTPVVSADCPSDPREILESGKYGKLVLVGDASALADAIITKLSEKSDVDALRQKAQKYSLDNTVKSYLELMHLNEREPLAKTR